MLILDRSIDQALVIDDIIVRVVSIRGSEVTLAISSPNSEPRYREVTINALAHTTSEPLKTANPR